MEIQFDPTRKAHCQGDVYLVPIKVIPQEALSREIAPVNGRFTITHSESGHHHIVKERSDIRQFSGMDMFRGFLDIVGEPAMLEHLRDHHTHAPQVIEPGAWLIQRQAAYTPQGWERARD